jgi:hypothetical protein
MKRSTTARVFVALAAIIAVPIVVLGVSWWRMQQRFQEFIGKTRAVEKGSSVEGVIQIHDVLISTGSR